MAASTRSQTERLWLIGGALVALVVLIVAYVALISPQRSETSTVRSEFDAARRQNTTLQARIDALRTQTKNMTEIENRLVAARNALPSTSGVPDFLRTLQTLGTATTTRVTSLTVGAPTDVSQVATGAGAASPAPTSATPTTAAAGAAPGATAAPSSASVFGLTISAQVSGSANSLNMFLKQLQGVQPRAVLITQITEGSASAVGSGTAAGSTTLQLTMQAFVAPSSAAENANLAAATGH